MVTEKYVPYKGVFGDSAVIETTLNWFNNSSELCFLWVYPDGKSDFKTMGAATRAGKVVVSGNRVKISALTNGETTSESVFVYRASSVKTQAYQVSEGVIPLSSIINELEELRRLSEDVKTEVAKAIRVPEWDGETHFTDKDSRAGKVMGFDKDGNPTTGEDCQQVKDLFEAGKAVQESASSAAAQAQEAKRQADIAGTHASDCNDSVAECSDLLKESELEANKAKTYYEKTASAGADSVDKATVAANRAAEAKDAAVAAKDAVLAAKEEVASKTQELDKAVCYISCAASEVEGRVETAKQELTDKAEQTKQEIAEFTDVYKKSETYSKSQIDGVSTGAEVTLKMNEIHAMLKDYEEVTGEKLPFELWEAVMAEFQRWQMNPNEVKEWLSSNNPFYTTPPTKPVVRFDVSKVSRFALETDVETFFPFATNTSYFMASNSVKLNKAQIAPNSTDCSYFCGGNPVYNRPTYFKSCRNFERGLFNCTGFASWACLPNCSSAPHAFSYTKMPAINIAKTLDSLPAWTDGASHTTSFVNNGAGVRSVATTETITVEVDGQTYSYENFPRFLTDDENETLRYAVARATAKGWTVQFSAA